MKAALLTGLALCFTAHLAQAQVLASDDFSYVGPLTSNGWTAHSGAGNKVVMADGSVATLEQSGGSGEDVNIAFPAQTAADTTYASFDFSVTAPAPIVTDGNGLYFAHFKDSGFNFSGRTGLVMPAAGGDFGLAYNGDSSNLGAGATWAGDLNFGVTYTVVISWDSATGQGFLWLNPTDMSSMSITHTGGSAGDLVEAFGLRQSNDMTVFIDVDNVVVGKTFDDVMGGGGGLGTPYCFGDGTSTACPCGNGGGAGEGCANGTGAGAILSATGSASIGAADLVLHGMQTPANQPGLFFQGNNAVNGGNGLVFGDGLRCAGTGIIRVQVVSADGTGHSMTSLDVGAKGGVSVGDVRRYQLWYRDPAGSPCGALFNLSNGLELTWSM